MFMFCSVLYLHVCVLGLEGECSFRDKFLHYQAVHSVVTMAILLYSMEREQIQIIFLGGAFWDQNKQIMCTNVPLEISHLALPNYKYILLVLTEKRGNRFWLTLSRCCHNKFILFIPLDSSWSCTSFIWGKSDSIASQYSITRIDNNVLSFFLQLEVYQI